ncbi:GMC family oxidoreductase, partial [Salmonella enterica subsp. enterica serovar Enteritidis]|nr:GMC family oxidoreductase [Salmonella enterica subsp. enterica serovar Enteritidis]
ATGPYATNAEPYDGRPATNQDGFNFQGDKTGAKWSTLVAELPKAEATGNLDLRSGCHVAQVTSDASGKVDGVLYFE